MTFNKNVTLEIENLLKNGKPDAFLDRLFTIKKEIPKELFSYHLGLYNYAKHNNPMALYHFERSFRQSFYNKSVREQSKKSIENLEQQINDNGDFSQHLVEDSLFTFPYVKWEVGSLALFVILVLLVLAKYLKRNLLYKLFAGMIGVTIIGVSIVTIYYKQSVIVQSGDIYFGPSKVYERKMELPLGEKIVVYHKHFYGWYRIVYPEKLRGWVEGGHVAQF